ATAVATAEGSQQQPTITTTSNTASAATAQLVHALVVRCTALLLGRRLSLRGLAGMGWAVGVMLKCTAHSADLIAVRLWYDTWSRCLSHYDVAAAPVSELCDVLSAWAELQRSSAGSGSSEGVGSGSAAGGDGSSSSCYGLGSGSESASAVGGLAVEVDRRTRTRVLARLAPVLPSLPAPRLSALSHHLATLRWPLPPAWVQWLEECRSTAAAGQRARAAAGCDAGGGRGTAAGDGAGLRRTAEDA
ncbi:hypothetical protein Agub_g7649, partial [Astrephomene gubernaculifera]